MLAAAPWPPASHEPALCGLIEGGSPMSDITLVVGGGARRITYAEIAQRRRIGRRGSSYA